MKNKRGQEVIGMSYGVIFAVILIICLVAIAVYVIWIFIGKIQPCSQQGMFKSDLQSYINRAHQGDESNLSFPYSLSGDIKEVCFIDTSAASGIGAKRNYFNEFRRYFYQKRNMFFYPPEKACENSAGYEIANIDLAKITAIENPYCIPIKNGKINIVILKEIGQSVVLTR